MSSSVMVGSPQLSRPLSGAGDGDSGPLLTAACQQYAGVKRNTDAPDLTAVRDHPAPPLGQEAAHGGCARRDARGHEAHRVPGYGLPAGHVCPDLWRGWGGLRHAARLRPAPLMLSVEEVEALVMALSLLGRTGDKGLKAAAETIRAKVASVLPHSSKQPIDNVSLYAPAWGAAEPEDLDLSLVRRAIREERKLVISYCDEQGRASERVICPLAIVYFVEVINVAGWCVLRQAFRHFRADRIRTCSLSGGCFEGQGAELRARWLTERQSCRGPARASSRPEQPFSLARP